MSEIISTEVFKGAFILGAKRLEDKKDIINELNVFPVPDGDTGINMSMTVRTAVSEIENNDYESVGDLYKAISQGTLRGARGNSGVILSQLFRGFYKGIKTAEVINTSALAEAFAKATGTAYRAVMKPKEGTILTVAKAISDKALKICHEITDIGKFYDELVEEAEIALENTPELLPVLKQAGVVDSGGTGLVEILKGAADYINKRDTDIKIHTSKKAKKISPNEFMYSLNYIFCPEGNFTQKCSKDLEVYLESLGKLKRYSKNDDKFSISLLSNDPGRAITKSIKYGYVLDVKLETKINQEKQEKPAPVLPPVPTAKEKEYGFVAIASGDGIKDIFISLGVDVCIHGGQTMNPSTEDITRAIESVNAKTVFVLPNNKNILLAAKQAAEITGNAIVIPTNTIPQGISALIGFSEELNPEDNKAAMVESISYIKSGEITYAIRDTVIEDKVIKQGDYMGIGDSGILASEKNINKCIDTMLKELLDEDSTLISLYYGEDIKESDANKLKMRLAKKHSNCEIEMQYGGQPVYYYLLSIE